LKQFGPVYSANVRTGVWRLKNSVVCAITFQEDLQHHELTGRLTLQSNFFAGYMCFDLEGDADRTRSDSLNIDLSDEETEDVAPAKANDSKAGELCSWSLERIT
jgi:hypothetical protein